MALEEELFARLRSQCPRVFTPTAPFSAERPYLTWQHLGGQAVRWFDNSAPGFRNALLQVNAWADTKKEAFDLLRRVEDEMCRIDGLVRFTARPMEEPVDAYVEGNEGQEPGQLCGALQTYSIWGER